MVQVIVVGVSILFVIYICMTLLLIAGWQSFKPSQLLITPEHTTYSIVIPVRNEEEGIIDLLQDLNKQSYKNFEVLVVNDHSEDRTVELVKNFKAEFHLTLLHLGNQHNHSPKKAAIKLAISSAQGSMIVTTDGDCRVGKDWLQAINSLYEQQHPKLISGPVTFYKEKNWFEHVQTVEFMSLIGAGAISLHFKSPNMCNGANLIYSKSAFEEVGGFEGSEALASGDDEFLMHKIANKYPNQVLFLKSAKALVFTQAKKTLYEFVSQRKRWASKWNHYTNWKAILLAVFIYAFHFSFLLSLVYLCFNPSYSLLILSLIGIKTIVEFIYLQKILVFFNKKQEVFWIPLTMLFYSIYILAIGALGQFGGYQWKGRKLK